jgi:hypothetical protein
MSNKTKSSLIFDPLTITVDKPGDIFVTYRLEMATKIVEAILHCIKYGKSKIIFAEILVPKTKEIISLNIEEHSFLETLEKNLDTLVEYEEYELCAEIIKAKEKILKGLPKKSPRKKKSEAVDNLINTIKNL